MTRPNNWRPKFVEVRGDHTLMVGALAWGRRCTNEVVRVEIVRAELFKGVLFRMTLDCGHAFEKWGTKQANFKRWCRCPECVT